MPVLLGLFSWLLAGLVCGLTASAFLPPPARPGAVTAMLVGLTGALSGGLVATVFGFGGLASYDPRGLLVATLAALLAIVLWRLGHVARLAT
ncbi:MAG: hypothetical protein AAGE94_14350 [Acidobacteriota bacterium]